MEAKEYMLNKYREQGDYAFLPAGLLEEMVEKIQALDEAFMERSGVNNGAAYDDDAAASALFAGMKEAFAEYTMYLQRFTDDYLDYNEEYLESIGAIEWE
ncbi:hypothetical protein LJC07_06215 [Christensenellaceae bacterium OttesenSCG-928-L17]|nr:hypothetical protein [Christensenellaceae bacterium OttesenSCG-928-L17]